MGIIKTTKINQQQKSHILWLAEKQRNVDVAKGCQDGDYEIQLNETITRQDDFQINENT